MKKILNNKILSMSLIFLLLLSIHAVFKVNFNDDVWFKNIIGTEYKNIFEYIPIRYNTWSSRLVIESILIYLLACPNIIWCVMDSLIIMLIIYSIDYLFKNNKNYMLIFLIILLYPLHEMKSAGWYATTLNYLWPLALGLFSLIPIKNKIIEKKEKRYMYPLYILSIIFACNQEQMCAVILSFYIIFDIYLYKKGKLNKFLLIQTLISLISIIFILTCPGNNERSIIETTTWYPSYESFNILKKISLGIISTFYFLNYRFNFVVLVLLLLFPIISVLNKTKITNKIISLIPILIYILSSLSVLNIDVYIVNLFEKIKIFKDPVSDIYLNKTLIFSLFISLIFFITILINICTIFKSNKKILISLIYLAGLATRLIMSFSPTLYASSMRTFIFFDFSLIIIIYFLLDSLKYNKKIYNIILILIIILGVLSLKDTIIYSI